MKEIISIDVGKYDLHIFIKGKIEVIQNTQKEITLRMFEWNGCFRIDNKRCDILKESVCGDSAGHFTITFTPHSIGNQKNASFDITNVRIFV